MGRTPPVSIGLPVYNGEKYLTQSIESVLNQDFTDFELLISDNASIDSTWDICRHYAERDKRIRLHKNERNIGAINNFNLVFQQTTSPYFMWHSHDDLLPPNYIGPCYRFLAENKDYVLCCSRTTFIDDTGNETYSSLYDYNVESDDIIQRYSNCFQQSWHINLAVYGLIRRNILQELDLTRKVHGTDLIVLLQLSLMGKFHQLTEPTRYYRRRTYQSAKEAIEWYPKQLQGDNYTVVLLPHLRMLSILFNIIAHADLARKIRLRLIKCTLKEKAALTMWLKYDAMHLIAFCSYRSQVMYNILTKVYRYVSKRDNTYPRV